MIYELKYLKYKSKYLNLLTQIGGASLPDDILFFNEVEDRKRMEEEREFELKNTKVRNLLFAFIQLEHVVEFKNTVPEITMFVENVSKIFNELEELDGRYTYGLPSYIKRQVADPSASYDKKMSKIPHKDGNIDEIETELARLIQNLEIIEPTIGNETTDPNVCSFIMGVRHHLSILQTYDPKYNAAIIIPARL